MKTLPYILLASTATLIGLYPIIYFLIAEPFGLLTTKPTDLLQDSLWQAAFYAHITLGGLALLVGWSQFSAKLRAKKIELHRTLGKVYVISVLISGLCGLYIALYATGGIVSVLGFFSLALVWLSTTILAFNAIRKRKLLLHEKFMIFSYAACFAAVTLRIWLPLLTMATGEFDSAYRIVSWLCWVPNMAVAFLIVRRKKFNLKNPAGRVSAPNVGE